MREHNMHRFQDQVVIVTGGASGIGRATCNRFAEEGAKVIVADLNEDLGNKTVANLNGNAEFQKLDVASEQAWEALVKDVADRFGRLDILVNSAGVGTGGSIESTTLEDWNFVIDVNLTGSFLGSKHVIRTMRRLGQGGSIVNVASLASFMGAENVIAYCASKAGVYLMTKCTAMHCAKEKLNIRCNSVHPTGTDTEMVADYVNGLREQGILDEVMATKIPLGRLVQPEEIAASILFLASNDAAMITGIGLPVDGGVLAGPMGRHDIPDQRKNQ